MLFSPSPRRRRLQLRISERRLLLMAGDVLAIVLAVLAGLYIWAYIDAKPFTVEFVLPASYWFFVLTLLWLVLASANDFYELPIAANRLPSLQRLGLITLQMLVVYLLVFFLSPRGTLPRLFILYYGVISFGLIALWRVITPAFLGWATGARRVLIVGADDSAESIICAIGQHGEDSYDIRGIISQDADVGRVVAGVPVIGTHDDLSNYIQRDRISELIITTIPDLNDETFRSVMQAYEIGIALLPMPILYERLTGRVPVQYVRNNWAVVLPITGQSIFNPYQSVQRLMDILLSLAGLAVLIVLLPLLALAIRLDSPGGVFYRQMRVGLNGRLFRIVKFRTMIKDAEQRTGAVFSQPGDDRVTRVGRFLRKTRLDELPQVINVLRGDMSVIGPRPERPEHVNRLTQKIPFYRTRLIIRPGLTGWAQVRYNYGSDDEDALVKLEYDLYYIRNRSLLLDLSIMVRTVGKVLRMAGV
jgi:exopolysaccharide biosynthesis polyprenyl glycosylphosphotransferase